MIFIREKDIQNDIRIGLNDIAVVFRANVGLYFTRDGRPVNVGLPPGFSDVFGFRLIDSKAFFIEIKNEKGKASLEQLNFLKVMKSKGAITGIARSREEAIEIIKNG